MPLLFAAVTSLSYQYSTFYICTFIGIRTL